jgi:DnaB-like helicase C terminal domain/Toprim-like
MSETSINHKKLHSDFLHRSNIVDFYNHIKPAGIPEPTQMNNGNKIAHAFWRGDKKKSLSLDPKDNRAYDFGENKGYNTYSLGVEALGSKEATYMAMAQVAGLDLDNYIWKTKLEKAPKVNTNQKSENEITGLPQFYQLSTANQELIKKYRGIDYNKLNSTQKSILVQNDKGEICLLYKYKGQIRFYQRWLPDSEAKYMSGKGTTPKETYSLGGLNTLTPPTGDNKQDLFIVEGFFDMLAMQLSGFNCITKYNAKANSNLVATWIKENAQYFDNIYLALDNDKNGIEGISDVVAELGDFVKEAKIYKALLKKPEDVNKLDANDIFRERLVTKDDFEITRITVPEVEQKKEKLDYLPVLEWDDIAKQREPELLVNSYGFPIEKQAMTIIGALSGHGKTTGALNIVVDAASHKNQSGEDQRVLYIMLEERPITILAKLQSIYLKEFTPEITKNNSSFNLVGFHTKLIKQDSGEINHGDDLIQISQKAKQDYTKFKDGMIKSKKISIIDATSNDIDTIIKSIDKAFEANYYDAVIIDYIQNIKPSADKATQIRQVQLASISSQLAPIAVRLNTALIVGAQFRRDVDGLDALDLSKIREAGDIGQDAHLAIGFFNHSDPTKNAGTNLRLEITARCLKIRGNRFDDIILEINHMTWTLKNSVNKLHNQSKIQKHHNETDIKIDEIYLPEFNNGLN